MSQIQEKLSVHFPGSKAIGIETRFISSPVAATLLIEIAQDNGSIYGETPPKHRVKLMVELFLVFQVMILWWCVDSHCSYESTCVLKPFINRSDLSDTIYNQI